MIFRQTLDAARSFNASLDATGKALQRLLNALARVLGAVNTILSALRQLETILGLLEKAIGVITRVLGRFRAGPPPVVVVVNIARQLLVAARAVLRKIRRALKTPNQRLKATSTALTVLEVALMQVASRVMLVRPEIQSVIDLAAALERQQEALEPLLPDAVKARIRALLGDLAGFTGQLDRLQSGINDRAATLEQVADTLEPIANSINAQVQALRAAVAGIEGVADALSNFIDQVEKVLNNIPLVGALLELLDDIGDAIDRAIQAVLDATGISRLINDAINALTQFDELVDSLREAAAQVLQLTRIQRAIQRLADDLEDLLQGVLAPIRDLVNQLRGLALIKLVSEVFFVRLAGEIPREQEELRKKRVAADRVADRLTALSKGVAEAAAAHPIPLIKAEALASIEAVQGDLLAAARHVRRKSMDKADERLESALANARRVTALFPRKKQSAAYFGRLAKLTGVKL